MDGRGFDDLTRKLAKGASRRSLLKGILGGAGAVVATTVVRGGVSAAPGDGCNTQSQNCGSNLVCVDDPNGTPNAGFCECPAGATSWCASDGVCIDEATQCCDNSDCVLEAGGTCVSNQCQYPTTTTTAAPTTTTAAPTTTTAAPTTTTPDPGPQCREINETCQNNPGQGNNCCEGLLCSDEGAGNGVCYDPCSETPCDEGEECVIINGTGYCQPVGDDDDDDDDDDDLDENGWLVLKKKFCHSRKTWTKIHVNEPELELVEVAAGGHDDKCWYGKAKFEIWPFLDKKAAFHVHTGKDGHLELELPEGVHKIIELSTGAAAEFEIFRHETTYILVKNFVKKHHPKPGDDDDSSEDGGGGAKPGGGTTSGGGVSVSTLPATGVADGASGSGLLGLTVAGGAAAYLASRYLKQQPAAEDDAEA